MRKRLPPITNHGGLPPTPLQRELHRAKHAAKRKPTDDDAPPPSTLPGRPKPPAPGQTSITDEAAT